MLSEPSSTEIGGGVFWWARLSELLGFVPFVFCPVAFDSEANAMKGIPAIAPLTCFPKLRREVFFIVISFFQIISLTWARER